MGELDGFEDTGHSVVSGTSDSTAIQTRTLPANLSDREGGGGLEGFEEFTHILEQDPQQNAVEYREDVAQVIRHQEATRVARSLYRAASVEAGGCYDPSKFQAPEFPKCRSDPDMELMETIQKLPVCEESGYDEDEESIISDSSEEEGIFSQSQAEQARLAYDKHVEAGGSLVNRTKLAGGRGLRGRSGSGNALPPHPMDGPAAPTQEFLRQSQGAGGYQSPVGSPSSDPRRQALMNYRGSPRAMPPAAAGGAAKRPVRHITPQDIEKFKLPQMLAGMTKGLAGVGGDKRVYDLSFQSIFEALLKDAPHDESAAKRCLRVARQGKSSLVASHSFWEVVKNFYTKATRKSQTRDGVRAATLVLALASYRVVKGVRTVALALAGSIPHMLSAAFLGGKIIINRYKRWKYRKDQPSSFKQMRKAFKMQDFERFGFVLGGMINHIDPTPFNKFYDTVDTYNGMIQERRVTSCRQFFLNWIRFTFAGKVDNVYKRFPKFLKERIRRELGKYIRGHWEQANKGIAMPEDQQVQEWSINQFLLGFRMKDIVEMYNGGKMQQQAAIAANPNGT